MKTTANGQATVKANNIESIAMPMGEYGDLCYDYYGKGSVIVFGNTDDHREQLEQMGGKYSDRLRYSALQNGRKWTEKQGRTAGYYFTTEQGKVQAVKYVQRVNHSIFDKYEQDAAKMGDRIQRREDLKEGDRVRTIHGVGTVTAHEPKYNKRVSVCVKLDKFTYNYGWKGMPHTFIECRCDEVAVLQEISEIKAAHMEQGRIFGQSFDAEYYRGVLASLTGKKKVFHFGIPADTVRVEVKRECEGYWRISMKRGESSEVERFAESIDWETILNTNRAADFLSDLRADHTKAHPYKLGDRVRVNDERCGRVNGHAGRITRVVLKNGLVGSYYTVEFTGDLPTYKDGKPMTSNEFEPLDIEPVAA